MKNGTVMRTCLLISLLLLLSRHVSVLAFQPSCEALFETVIQKAAEQRKSVNKKGFEMELEIRVTQQNQKVVTDNMTVKWNKNRYLFQSNALTLYQDEKDLVTIQHDPKLIFVTNAQPASMRELQFGQVFTLMDSLRKHMKWQRCEREFGTIEKNEGYQKIILAPSPELYQAGIKHIQYWIHEPTVSVKKIRIDYTPENEYGIRQYEMIIRNVNYDYKGIPFDGLAIKKVLHSNVLLAQFSKYELVDKR